MPETISELKPLIGNFAKTFHHRYLFVECVLFGGNFDFLGSFLLVTARYLVVTARYCSLLGGYWWLLLVTARYCSFPLLV